MEDGEPLVAVYIVTYRRHVLLRRSIASVLCQSHRNLRVHVVNDDPDDPEVEKIVGSFADPRISVFDPMIKRGATGSFALVFEERDADYVALLEDDNLWEPGFIAGQVAILQGHSEIDVVVGNERIWREEQDGTWTNTDRTIWPFDDVRHHHFTLETICGSATYCNSSALIRVKRKAACAVPGCIPVDVTEHFRERNLAGGMLLNGDAQTDYAETLVTARSTRGHRWGHYQQLLIASSFIALHSPAARDRLARALWHKAGAPTSPRSVSLVLTGLAFPEARALVWRAGWLSRLRALAMLVRRRGALARPGADGDLKTALEFLVAAPLTQALARDYEAGHT
jgi:hypothetical protein